MDAHPKPKEGWLFEGVFIQEWKVWHMIRYVCENVAALQKSETEWLLAF